MKRSVKNYLLLFLLMIFAFGVNAQQISGTQITSSIVPNDIQDNYPTHVDSLGFGGYRVVPTITARDAIKSTRKVEGMLVYVAEDDNVYKLETLPNTWILFSSGGGSSPWYNVPGGIAYDNNVTVGDTLKLNGRYRQNINNIAITGADTINKNILDFDVTTELTALKTVIADRREITLNNNGGINGGKLRLEADNLDMFNYNDSILILLGKTFVLKTENGIVANTQRGFNQNTHVFSTGNDSSYVKRNLGLVSKNQLESQDTDGAVYVGYNNVIEASSTIGDDGRTYVDSSITTYSLMQIDSKNASSLVDIGSLYGMKIKLEDKGATGTINIDNITGLKLENTDDRQGDVSTYGIYENFGQNLFNSYTTIYDSLRVTDTAYYEKPIYINGNLFDGSIPDVSGQIHDSLVNYPNRTELVDSLGNYVSRAELSDTATSMRNDLGGGASMIYPSAGIALSTGTSWNTSIIDNSANWNTAYGWGDHSTQGYITASSSDVLTNKSGNISQWTNDVGYLTTYSETDPIYTSSQASNITATDITNLSNLSGINTGDQDLSGYAIKSNVLELDNTSAFTPDADYEPATKKYVDDISPLTTKGDLWTYSNQDARLPLGNDGQILLAASYLDEGLKWSDQVEQSSLLKSKLPIGDNNTSLWLTSPKAHYYKGNIYFVYNDYNDNLRKIAKYSYSTGTWNVTTWTQTSFTSGNTDGQDYAHCAPTVFMDSNGYIHIAYGGYKNGQLYTVRSTNPNDISSFEAEVNVKAVASSSYPTIYEENGTLILMYRGFNTQYYLGRFLSSDNGATWSNDLQITTANYPYFQSRVDKNGRVHIAYHFKDPNHRNLYYIYTDDIEAPSPTFYDITGSVITLPAGVSDAVVFNSTDYDNCYLLGMDADNASRPHIFAYLSDITEENRLSYFSYRNSTWVEDTIELGTFTSFGTALVEGDVQFKSDSTLCLMSEYITDPNYGTYGKSEIKEWISYDYGATWNFNKFITEKTKTTTANPLYIRESGEIMWFEGNNDYGVGKSVYIGFEPTNKYTSPVIFNKLPYSPNQTPTQDYEFATKKYVDDNSGGGSSLPSGTQGDILYHNGSDWTTLTAGTSGDFLKTQGTGANPIWDTPSGGSSLWSTNGNEIYYDTDNVGVGVSDPQITFHVRRDNLSLTGAQYFSMLLETKTTGDMVDRFGPTLDFAINDNANVTNRIVRFGGIRDGADNSGKFLILTNNEGSFGDPEFTVDHNGLVGIGIGYDTPDATLHINDFMKLEPRSSAPSSPSLGMIYVNSTDNHIYFYNGTSWVQLDN